MLFYCTFNNIFGPTLTHSAQRSTVKPTTVHKCNITREDLLQVSI